jgi:hypothetical protein
MAWKLYCWALILSETLFRPFMWEWGRMGHVQFQPLQSSARNGPEKPRPGYPPATRRVHCAVSPAKRSPLRQTDGVHAATRSQCSSRDRQANKITWVLSVLELYVTYAYMYVCKITLANTVTLDPGRNAKNEKCCSQLSKGKKVKLSLCLTN